MITRTLTSNFQTFKRSGNEAVTYDLSIANRVTITLPPGSKWTSELHWHETHTEFLKVLQGRAFVRLGNRAGNLGPEDGVVEVPKYTVHEWHRPQEDESQEDLIVQEWTLPEDGQKEVFFRNLNSFLTERQPSSMYEAPVPIPGWAKRWLEHWIIPLQLFSIFRSWDNWPVFAGDDAALLSWTITHMILGICSVLGSILGLKESYAEYVSEALRSAATRPDATKKTKTR